MTHSTSKNGFTIIELMIVVAIAGIFLAILIPNYARYLDKTDLLDELADIRVEYSVNDAGDPIPAPCGSTRAAAATSHSYECQTSRQFEGGDEWLTIKLIRYHGDEPTVRVKWWGLAGDHSQAQVEWGFNTPQSPFSEDVWSF